MKENADNYCTILLESKTFVSGNRCFQFAFNIVLSCVLMAVFVS